MFLLWFRSTHTPMSENHHHHTVAREDLLCSVKMALHMARYLWPKKRGPGDHEDARIELIATEVVEHLELCGIRCVRKGPASPYGTLGPRPAPRQGASADMRDLGCGNVAETACDVGEVEPGADLDANEAARRGAD